LIEIKSHFFQDASINVGDSINGRDSIQQKGIRYAGCNQSNL
jgi:hypothetical protein